MKILSLPIEYTKGDRCEKGLISWGDDNCYFYSYNSSKTFYLSFKESPVSIDKIKIMTKEDVFPNDFSIFLSNDNKTWINIIKNETFCDAKNIKTLYKKSYGCENRAVKYINANKIAGYYFYLKFEMTTNTYEEEEEIYFKNLIAFKGFEIFGKFLTKYVRQTSKCVTRKHSQVILLLLTTSS